MKNKRNFGGGQSIRSPFRSMTDGAIRRMIVESHEEGHDISDVISALGGKNTTRGWELYYECPTLALALKAA